MSEPVRLFVGGLNYNTTVAELKAFVQSFGYEVVDAHIVMDHETGRSKGFGFVAIVKSSSTDGLIAMLNGKELAGRTLTVNKALPKQAKK